MQHLEVSGAVRPLKWSLGVKWLIPDAEDLCVSNPSCDTEITLIYSSNREYKKILQEINNTNYKANFDKHKHKAN